MTSQVVFYSFFFNDTATTEIYTLSLHDALPIFEDGEANPALIIGVPVGFVSAAESKEQLRRQGPVPYITNRGRKGGTPVAVSITHALLRMARGRAGEEGGARKCTRSASARGRPAASTSPRRRYSGAG